MSSTLPAFPYHPDPVASGVIVASESKCVCCNQARGLVYIGPAHTKHEGVRENLCPWCIADGSAASKFDVEFADAHPLFKAGIDRKIVDVVTKQTLGYFSWQQDDWLTHCRDACAFHGHASAEDIKLASRATIEAWKTEYGMTDIDWNTVTAGYQPRGHSAFYKFVCRKCSQVLLGWDMA
jgi:uncharacterized protein